MGNWNHGKYLEEFREVWEKLKKFEGNFVVHLGVQARRRPAVVHQICAAARHWASSRPAKLEAGV